MHTCMNKFLVRTGVRALFNIQYSSKYLCRPLGVPQNNIYKA